jgi:hypothetical protein
METSKQQGADMRRLGKDEPRKTLCLYGINTL